MDVVGPMLDPTTLSSLALEPTMTTTTTDEHGTTTTTIFNVPTIDGSSLLNAFPSCGPQGLVIATGPDGSGTVYIENQFVFSSTDNGTAHDVIQPAVTYVPVDNGDAPITAGDVQPASAFIRAAETATDASMTAVVAAVDVQPPVGKGPYRCQVCVKVFPKWTQLQRHLKKHADDKKFACTECDASFNFESNLVLHKSTHNPDCSECPECGKRFSRTASLRAHIMVHEKEEYLVCNECGDEFPTQSKLDTHLKRHRDTDTNAQRNYVCKQCSQVFWKASTFRDHMKNHYRLKASLSRRTFKRNVDRSTFVHKCASCEKSFQKPSQLSRHTRIHTGERPFGCTQCGKAFNQKGALLIHQKKHSGEKPHTCEFCPAAFAQKGNLRAHIRRVHMVTTKDPSGGGSGAIVAVTDGQTTTLYRCERCACAFRKLGSLNAHMSRMHSSEVSAIINGDDSSPNNGKTVNDVIKQIIQLSEHAEAADQAGKANPSVRHSTDDILQQALQNSGLTSVQGSAGGGGNAKKTAEDGGAATSVSNGDHCTSSIVAYADSATGALKRHVVKRVDGIRVHQCVYCVKVFKKPSDLVRHIRIHTREKPYKCSQCFRSFAVKSTLTAHVKAHSGVKEFGCDVCEKLFATQGSLRVHRRLHTGVKPFSCPHCTKFFRTSGHRKSHLITHGITSSTTDGGEGNRKARQRRITSNATLPEEERTGGGERRPPPVRRVARHNSPKEAVSSTVVSDLPYLEPILITDTGFVQVAPRGQRAFGELFAEPPAAHRPYRCAFCSQAFKKSSHLKQHVRSHTGEKPYKCQLCYRCFVSSGVLKAHMRTHSGVKSHQCHVCDSAFTTKGSLKRHMSTHSELRPFMCPYCQKTFKTTVNCKKHMKTHNKQEMYSQVLRRIEDGVVDENADILLKDDVNVQVSEQKHEQQQEQQQMDVEQPVVSQVPEMVSQDQDMTLSETLSHLQHSLNQLSQQLDGHHDVELIGSDLVVGGEEVKSLHVHAFEQHAFEQFSAGGPFTLHTDASLPSQCTLDISGLDPDQVGLSGHELLAVHQVGSHHDGVGGGVDLEGLDGGGCLEGSSDGAVLNHQVSDVNGNVHAGGLEPTGVITEQGVEDVEEVEEVDDDEDDGDEDAREEGEALAGTQAEVEDQLKRIHKCTYCDSAFKRASHLKQHIRSHTGERPFKCQQCSHMFVSPSALKGHLRTHVGAKDFKCHVCSAVFTTNGSLRRHMTVHSNVQPYKCVYCNESFRTQVMGKRHMRIHSSEIAATTTPVSTPATMTTPAVVSAVPRKRPSSKKPVIKSTASIAHNSKPVAKSRKRTRPLVVQFTEEQTVSLASQAPNDFASVSEKILIASAVERDRLSEARDRPLPASGTTAPETTAGTTVKHTHQCFHCPKSFKKPSDLSRHERIHTGEKPFQCDLCLKTFTVKSTLDSHLKTHSGEKDFVCHVCNSRFATKGSLKVHMRLHTGAKPFKCSVCEQRFRTSGHRKSHMMIHLKGSAGTSTSSSQKKSNSNNNSSKKKKPTRSAPSRARPVNHKVVMATTESPLPAQSSSSSSEAQVLPPPSLPDKNDQGGTAEGEQSDVIGATDATNLMTFGTNAVLDGSGNDGGVYQLETLNSINGDSIPNITVSLEGLTADQLITTDGVHLQGLQTIQIDASILQQLQQQGNVNITLDASFLAQGLTLESALLGGSDGVAAGTANGSNVVLQPMSITLPLSMNDQSTVNSLSYDQSINANDGCTEVSLSINEDGEMVTTVSKVLPDDAQLIEEVPVDSVAATVAAVAAAKRNQPRTFACEVCPKQFKRFANLKDHLSTHYPNGNGVGGDIELRPPPLNYKCQVCSKQFGKPSQLERHLRIHTGERPFVCGVCDRAFNQRNALVIHMNKHTGDRPHLCFFCGQLFAQKGNLRVHVRRVHMKPVHGAATSDVVDGQQQASGFEPSNMMVGDCLDIQPDSNVSN